MGPALGFGNGLIVQRSQERYISWNSCGENGKKKKDIIHVTYTDAARVK